MSNDSSDREFAGYNLTPVSNGALSYNSKPPSMHRRNRLILWLLVGIALMVASLYIIGPFMFAEMRFAIGGLAGGIGLRIFVNVLAEAYRENTF